LENFLFMISIFDHQLSCTWKCVFKRVYADDSLTELILSQCLEFFASVIVLNC